ncbi:P-loop containing nucleoside triphosphate hydrolase protein [Lipomyces tetrasporus]|uniref:P-loop containing nucleoside triphosphate hydrolase protein n=1 Tax=Lipomyces tetrasporus TaxID=54092 RepID=A0AAD7VQB2_9ASCO|nr:P-loop containing nucleoside triphosphate hydrolase protein [Lipomyces tetrasporus]KAJ8098752.1 P-loop containing nucleoside triphosphate hydrolase protein [Lipomyces tetrasporus]
MAKKESSVVVNVTSVSDLDFPDDDILSAPYTHGTLSTPLKCAVADEKIYLRVDDQLLNIKPSYLSLFRFIRRKDAFPILVGIIMTVISGVHPSVTSILIGKVFNCISAYIVAEEPYPLTSEVTPYLVGMLSVGLVSIVIWNLLLFSWTWVSENQLEMARSMLLDSLMTKDNAWYDALDSSGALVTKAQKFLDEYQEGASLSFGHALFYTSRGLISLCVAMYFSWRLTIVILATLPAIMIAQTITNIPKDKFTKLEKQFSSRAINVVDWAISSFQTVKLFNGQSVEAAKFSAHTHDSSKVMHKIAIIYALQQGILKLLVLMLFLQGFWYGGHLVREGGISSGNVLTVFWCCNSLTYCVSNIGVKLADINKAKVAAESLWAIIDDFRHTNKKQYGMIVQECHGDIEFKNVTFAYPSRPHAVVLKGASLRIPVNRLTFIVGGSGSGKSTLHSLLLNMYSPQSGSVSLDGMNVSFLLSKWLRHTVTVVQQDSVLFRDTIANNIRLGSDTPWLVDDEDIKRAVRLAMLTETVNDLPDGIDTFLVEGGNELSGGQRQRIALARAIIRDTPILVLDEATSALDIIARGLIVDAMRMWREGRTTLIITHDIASIDLKDHVIVMKDGRVVQQGLRGDLESENGAFIELVKSSQEYIRDEVNDDSLTVRVQKQRVNDIEKPAISHSVSRDGRTRLTKSVYTNVPFLDSSNLDLNLARWSVFDTATTRYSKNPALPTAAARRWTQFRTHDSMFNSDIIMASGNNTHRLRQTHRRDAVPATNMENPIANARKYSVVTITDSLVGLDEKVKSVSKRKAKEGSVGALAFLLLAFRTQRRKTAVLLGLLVAVINGAAMPAFSYTFARLVYTIFPDQRTPQSKWESLKWPLIVLGISCVDAVSTFGHTYILEVAGDRWVYRLRNLAFRKILTRDWSWFIDAPVSGSPASTPFDENTSRVESLSFETGHRTAPALSQVINNDADELRVLLGRLSGTLLSVMATFSIGLLWSFVAGWQLTLVAISTAPVAIATSKFYAYISDKWTTRHASEAEKYIDIAYECITKVRTVKTLTLERHFREKLNTASRAIRSTGLKRGFYIGIASGLNSLSDSVVLVIVFFYGAVLISKATYSVIQFFTVANLVTISFGVTSSALKFLPNIDKVKKGGVRLLDFAMMDSATAQAETSGQGTMPGTAIMSGDIQFRGVKYSYPGRQALVLDDVSLSVSGGEVLAIVGASGCGKSTLSTLVTRMLIPNDGCVRIGGVDVMDIDVQFLRRHIAVVTQNSVLFDGSIYENLVYGLKDNEVSNDDVRTACELAGIHEFILSLGEGYNTQVGGSTSLLSGGQTQRLAIARALVRKPAILVLDECTSALDTTTSEHIRQTVISLKKRSSSLNPTVLMITHSRDMMECTDRIVVMDAGRVVEIGRFADLMMNRGGYLANLVSGGEWS